MALIGDDIDNSDDLTKSPIDQRTKPTLVNSIVASIILNSLKADNVCPHKSFKFNYVLLDYKT